ncbi:Uma2 family endonuclease [Caldanaerobius fijiensis]|uniref:Uma2 family endonuclease n=1 Tax=Caldanaerobius fijiensis TaxID=456330 RepID=UPI000A02C71D|nr:Uma2 family endonuclease [Caldanaerobius fijiensis]
MYTILKDYLSWPEDEHWEIIDGNAYLMAPPPRIHQEILGAIFNQFYNYLNNKSCFE